MFNIGSQELLIILLLVFLFFGPRHLPEVARTLGKGLGDFQRTLRGVEDNVRRASEETIGRASAAPSRLERVLLESGGAKEVSESLNVPATAPPAVAETEILDGGQDEEPGAGLNPS